MTSEQGLDEMDRGCVADQPDRGGHDIFELLLSDKNAQWVWSQRRVRLLYTNGVCHEMLRNFWADLDLVCFYSSKR